MSIDLNQLRAFFEAAQRQSYTSAAQALHVTQSAVSHAIAKLEQSLGCELVEWRGRRMLLTAEGETLRESCTRIFAELDEVEQRLAGRASLVRTFRLGAPVEFGTTVLLPKVRPLVQAHPELHLDFHFSNQLAQPLLRGELDLIVDCVAHQHPELQRTALFREKYVVVATPQFLAANPIQSPLDLARVAVVSMDKSGSWWGNLLWALPDAARPVLGRIVEVNHLRGIKHAVEEGLGVGLLPKYAVLAELGAGRLQVVFPDLPLLEDRFAIYQRRAFAARPTNQLVHDFLVGLDVAEFGDSIGPVDA